MTVLDLKLNNEGQIWMGKGIKFQGKFSSGQLREQGSCISKLYPYGVIFLQREISFIIFDSISLLRSTYSLSYQGCHFHIRERYREVLCYLVSPKPPSPLVMVLWAKFPGHMELHVLQDAIKNLEGPHILLTVVMNEFALVYAASILVCPGCLLLCT